MGFSSDEEDPIASGDDEFGGAGHKLEGGGCSPFLENLAEFYDEGIPIAVPVGLPTLPVPSPLHRSPHRFFQSSTNATGEFKMRHKKEGKEEGEECKDGRAR